MKPCSICDRVGRRQEHHLTGRDHADNYLDPQLTVPMCHDHHTLCGDDWHTLGIATLRCEVTLIDRVELRLRRTATGLARIEHTKREPGLWGLLAATFDTWANELRTFRGALDAHNPRWRSHRGFYPDQDD